MKRKIQDYRDIISLPRHISDKHPHMSVHDRAAQFAPFAALTGHAEAVKESARIVERKIALGEDVIVEIEAKLNYLQEHIKEQPTVRLTWFIRDEKKKYGGRYMTTVTNIKQINSEAQIIVLSDYTEIAFDDIFEIEII